MKGIEQRIGQDRPLPVIAGGSTEITLLSKFVVNNVGGEVTDRREINRTMRGGRMVGGQNVDVPAVFSKSLLGEIKAIIADKANVDPDLINDDTRLRDLPKWESQVIDDITLEIEYDYLQTRNIPDSMVAVSRTPQDIWEALNILRLTESPIAGLSLADAKLQIANAWMYGKAEKYRDLWKEGAKEEQLKGGWADDEFITELTASNIKSAEPS